MTYKCEHCGSDGRIQVQAVVEAPAELAHQFSKQNMRRADVFFRGVLWETMDFICGNPKCGRVTDGYGNYVTGLKKRVEQLEAQLAAAPKLQVWYGSMPESNGKSNWTAILHAGDICKGFTIDRSEYPDRVRYEADCVRFLIGELKEEPFILDYDADKCDAAPPAKKEGA